MPRNVFSKALWDARRSFIGWTVAIVAVAAMYGASWRSVNNPQMLDALKNYPETLKKALNIEDLTTAAGYLRGSVYGLIVALLIAIFAIAWGTRAVAGDEEAGTLELVLAHPVSRRRLALQRFAALAVAQVVVSAALFLVMLAIAGPARFDGITAAQLAATSAQLALFGACLGALAFAAGAATGRRGFTLGLSAGVTVLAYLANTLIPQIDGMGWVRNLSPFHWYLGGNPLVNGFQVGDALILLAVTAALVAVGTWRFARRDLAA